MLTPSLLNPHPYRFYYRAMWVLPVTGFLVGYLTNWIALKMIFQPVEPVSLLGCYTCHGLFLKRQVGGQECW